MRPFCPFPFARGNSLDRSTAPARLGARRSEGYPLAPSRPVVVHARQKPSSRQLRFKRFEEKFLEMFPFLNATHFDRFLTPAAQRDLHSRDSRKRQSGSDLIVLITREYGLLRERLSRKNKFLPFESKTGPWSLGLGEREEQGERGRERERERERRWTRAPLKLGRSLRDSIGSLWRRSAGVVYDRGSKAPHRVNRRSNHDASEACKLKRERRREPESPFRCLRGCRV